MATYGNTIDLRPKKSNLTVGAGERWWLQEPDKAAITVTANLEYWAYNQHNRLNDYSRFARMYGNMPRAAFFGLNSARLGTFRSNMGERLTFNIVQSCIDTSAAKISTKKPAPYYLTNDGDYAAQRQAKDLNKFVLALFNENDTYTKGREAYRDAEIWGDGFIHVFEKYGRVFHERVPAMELWVDDVESLLAPPRQMHRVKAVDRQILLDMFPDKEQVIKDAANTDLSYIGGSYSLSDLVTVRESWHLPSGPDSEDGAHMISVSSGALTDLEPYTRDYFPFARFSYCPRPYGYWAQGLAEQLQNIQAELNKLLWVVQNSLHLAGTFKIWVKNGSGVAVDHLNNQIGAILRSDDKPEWILPTPVPPEVLQQIQTLKQSAYEQSGISAAQATSAKPAGLNSGVALREYNDMATERFAVLGEQYEEFYLKIARLSVDVIKDIFAREKEEKKDSKEGKSKLSYVVKSAQAKSFSAIDWADIEPDDEAFEMQVSAVSSLPMDPAGRLQTITEYMSSGLLEPEEGRALLDFPDLTREEDLFNAARDYLTKILDGIVIDSKYVAPEPFDNLQLALKLALRYYQKGKEDEISESKLSLLRQFIQDVQTLTGVGQSPPVQNTQQASPPLTNPIPPQPSELIPNAPNP